MHGLIMDYPLTIPSILEHGVRVFPGREIISYMPDKSRHQYTYADLYKRSKRLMHALVSKLGIKKGDIIGTFAWNHYQHMELYFAIPGAGGVCHTINIRLSGSQTAFIINNAEDRYIFVDATLVPLLEPIAKLLATVETFILLNAPENFSTTLPNCIHYEDLITGSADDSQWAELNEYAAKNPYYTSNFLAIHSNVTVDTRISDRVTSGYCYVIAIR